MEPKVSIVIPTYNHWNLTNNLLSDIYNKLINDIYEVIVVNNGSTEPAVKAGMDYWSEKITKDHKVDFGNLYIPHNIGFLKSANIGVNGARGDVVLLISNDVRLNSDDLVKKTVQQVYPLGKTIVGARYLDYPTGWNEFGGVVYPYLEGFLLGFLKKDWVELGGFDEQYAPCDFEDVDFSTNAREHGFTLVQLDSSVHHMGAQTIGYSPEREYITKRNKELFKAKWIK